MFCLKGHQNDQKFLNTLPNKSGLFLKVLTLNVSNSDDFWGKIYTFSHLKGEVYTAVYRDFKDSIEGTNRGLIVP